MINKKLAGAIALSLLAFTPNQQSQAAGFYIQEQSVKGLGSAFSGSVTSLEDASTIYFNPAGMTKLDRGQINVGTHLLIPRSNMTDTGSTFPGAAVAGGDGGNPYSPTPVPNFYAAYPVLQDRLWAGIGVSAPFGLSNDYDDGWFGRFDSTETSLTTINVQPSIAIKATEWLSIGGGIDIQYADAKLKAAVSNVASEGLSTLKGDDISYGFNAGIQIKPLPNTEFGAHYRSAMSHKLDGRISVEGLTAGNFDVSGTAALDLPDIATFGVAHDLRDDLRLTAQATWFGWNNFQDITAIDDNGTIRSSVVQNYQTTWAFAIGGEYDWNDNLTLRAGYQYDETPTTDLYRSTRTPDGDRNWFSTGASYKLNDNIDLDFAATYINISHESIDVARNSNLANVRAKTEGSVGIVAAGFTYKF